MITMISRKIRGGYRIMKNTVDTTHIHRYLLMENKKSKSEAIITGKSRIRGSGGTYIHKLWI